jgi:hypothetical protein
MNHRNAGTYIFPCFVSGTTVPRFGENSGKRLEPKWSLGVSPIKNDLLCRLRMEGNMDIIYRVEFCSHFVVMEIYLRILELLLNSSQ